MKLHKGFTLIELMIVVLIVSILAAVSIPAYNDYVRRGKITEAASTLSGVRVSMEQYYQDNRTYFNAGACGVVMPTAPAVKYFTFACAQGATTDSYTITATGSASMAGFTYTINQSNAKATTAVPTGWATSTTCWVTNKSGSC